MLLLVGAGVYLYLPRSSNATADNAATVAVLNTAVDAQKGSTDFAPALDGDIVASGDFVRSSKDGRAVLTFFDGSTLSVDPGSLVKVLTLNRVGSGGIQLLVEQTLGRSWAAVSKLKTPDSKFEIKTPSSIASVRGTAFETNVTQNADGTNSVTYKVDDGQVLVAANAGGSVTVGANQQVTIGTNQPAPGAATAQAPTPRLVLSGSTGLEFAITASTGASCGTENGRSRQEIFGCVSNGSTVTLREPPGGRYSILMKTTSAPGVTLVVDAFRGTTKEASRTFTGTSTPADLVRSGFTYAAATPQSISEFDPAQKVTSVCSAQATGRVFDAGAVEDRYAQLRTFAEANKGQPVALVVTEADLTKAGNASVPSDVPATVSDLRATIDSAGVHLSGQATASVLTVNAASDVSVGSVDGKLVVRVRSLSATPLPGGLLDGLRAAIERSFDELSNGFPFTVRQVALRQGCLSVMGTTP